MSFMLVTTNPKPTDPPFKDYFFMFLKVGAPGGLQHICSFAQLHSCSLKPADHVALLQLLQPFERDVWLVMLFGVLSTGIFLYILVGVPGAAAGSP
eukprot:1138294-Pelagomonas_calceolata.AAC.6